DAVFIAPRERIYDLGDIEPPNQETDTPIDFAQPLLAVDVVGVFGAVAVARRPCNGRDKLRTLVVRQTIELAFEARKTAGRHVVARAGRQRRRLIGSLVLFETGLFLAECLAHRTSGAGDDNDAKTLIAPHSASACVIRCSPPTV